MANGQYQKLVNSTQILRELRSGPKSRNYLVKTLGLQPSTITYSINRLKELKLVLDTNIVSEDNQTRGRKSTQIKLNPKAGVVFGVELLVDDFTITILNIDKSPYSIIKETFDKTIITAEKGSIERFKQCIDYILSLIEERCKKQILMGGCISIAGIVDSDGLTVVKSLTHDISNAYIGDCFKDKPYPVVLENDANCATIKYREENTDSFLYSLVRSYDNHILPNGAPFIGVGMGLVINGSLLRGWDSKAGEFVNFIYQGGKQNRQLDFSNELLSNLNEDNSKLNHFLMNYVDKLLFTNALINPRTIYLGGDSEIWNDKIVQIILEKFPEKNEEDVKNNMCFTFLQDTKDDVCYGACCLFLDFLFHMPYLNSAIKFWDELPSPLLDEIIIK